ncbi:aminotransferase-like domain-containing protein [Rhizobium laguerreae]|uniref:aminotransferase-like domain-containing protein n=1 Tax=Rhizobium laguerreae TaxID=1076926 RepID=UPI001C90EA2A|nr:PLP-dependent aminotransferase family protein [Rhizobium laguerreae]MBY3203457.1 PLP-dependent aminotransferase family protein [Rhizobium laguerreae]
MSHHFVEREVALKSCFANPQLSVMTFLSEVVLDYPSAISLAPGRPSEEFFHTAAHVAGIGQFVESEAAGVQGSADAAWGRLGQYDRTNGTINSLIARHLEVDEGIHTNAESIMVTVGAQEAMAVLLCGLFDPATDVLLSSDPTYIGITGLARILGINVAAVATGADGLEPHALANAIAVVTASGKRARAIYDIPDFNNPMGTSIPLANRHEILATCRTNSTLYLEDNAYGMFAYETRLPTLKSLDRHGDVIYIGSFAKTLFPGLRLGYLVADQRVARRDLTLAQVLSSVKSLLTVNTPGVCQAVAGAALTRHGGSLEPIVAPKRREIRLRRDAMLDSLEREFASMRDVVTWNRPAGGYFLTVTLPFEFGSQELKSCAADYGVIPCPMRFFALQDNCNRQVRLSFSYANEQAIAEGIKRLARFARDKVVSEAKEGRQQRSLRFGIAEERCV